MSTHNNVHETAAGAGNSRAMETRDHSKNGVSPKNLMSRRNFKFGIILIAMLAFGMSAFAQGGTTGPLTWELTGTAPNMTLTISGEGEMPDYDWGSNAPWFPYTESIETVVIETGVTSIGNIAFYGCGLTSVTFPSELTDIGEQAFSQCTKLTSITIPSGVTSIRKSAFAECTSLTSVTLPSGLTSIGGWAFRYCTSLTSITLPSGLTDIGNYAFQNCTSLTSITFPSGLTSIGNSAFADCTSLTSITFPSGLTSIGEDAFENCTSLASITLPSGLTSIGNGAFANCTKLASITLLSGLTYIGEYVFYNCTKLTSITFPSGLTGIGDSAFLNCTSLTSITFPSGLIGIGISAFENCTSLASITFPSGLTSIGNSAFADCTSLTSITFPSGLTFIGSWAFQFCTKLTSVTLPSGLTSIGNSAFRYCTKLTSVTLPSGLTSIGGWAFQNCTSLTSITLPSGLTDIGNYAFQNCTSLTSITNLNLTPVDIYHGVFEGVNQSTCTLTVATSAVSAYETAAVWEEFNIVGGGILVNPISGNIKQGYTIGNGLYEEGGKAIATVTAVPHIGYKFVNWTKNGIVVSIDNPYSFPATEDVELVANFVKDDVGIVEPHDCASLQIYPNPVNDKLKITNYEGGEVTIYDITGRTLMSLRILESPETAIDVSHLPSGIYFIKIGEKTAKFVKE